MRNIQQETSARRNQFDCQLPEDARAELLKPKPKRARILGEPPATTQPVEHPSPRAERILEPQRARILGKPPQPPKKRSWLDSVRRWWHPAFSWILALVGVAALCAVSRPSPEKRARALQESAQAGREAEAKATEALKALQPSTPALSSVQPAPSSTPAVLEPEVRRAGPVTVKRAEQVFRLGVWSPVWMPDGKLTWVRFLGVKDTFADLPATPQIGDSWGVMEGGQHALWVWHTLPGHIQPAWVDP